MSAQQDAGYCEGLLDAQKLANAYSHRLFAHGNTDAANEFAAMSTTLLELRERVEKK